MDRPLLDLLEKHPLLSPDQLGVLLASHPNVIRKRLQLLQKEKLVARINPRSPALSPRALFYLTDAGLRLVGTKKNPDQYRRRLAHLFLVIERAYHVRNLFLRMQQPFGVTWWDVEGAARFSFRSRTRALPLHGVGLAQTSHCTLPFVVEWDTGVLEYERTRMARLVEWNYALRNQAGLADRSAPVLLVVAQDAQRLQSYYAHLRAASLSRNLPIPPTFLTVAGALMTYPIKAAIWFSAEGKNKQTLFANLPTSNHPKAPFVFQSVRPRIALGKNAPDPATAVFDHTKPTCVGSLVALKRELAPQTKRVLDEVAAHPLLTALEYATLLADLSGQVHRGLKQLARLGVIQAHRRDDTIRYLVSETGVHYLAATSGFGNAAGAYRNARGWKRSLNELVRHWEHTQIENSFFLSVAELTRARDAHFEWQSESESRLHYAARGRRWSFSPDGMGFYREGNKRIRLAVEIERHRNSRKRLRLKFNWYAMYTEATLHRTAPEAEFRLLIVTTS
ncbi:MAG: replication-relaxation family protein [Anaerolineae bacterium]|nr:replication-relaxation family protein [Anaerolineae bacterium]